MSARILVVDNYDSFVFNLVQYLYQLGAECEVVRNDAVSLGRPGLRRRPALPRPRHPRTGGRLRRHGASLRRATGVPVFGVCLGMQSMWSPTAASWAGPPSCCTARPPVLHQGAGVFAGLPSPFTATRYHSLAVEPATLPAELEVTARTEAGVIMGLRHRELPVEGVQFHPESVLTERGHRMLANWLGVRGHRRRRAFRGARAGGYRAAN